MADDGTNAERRLRRIADALGVSIESLLQKPDYGGRVASPEETQALMTAFALIEDPAARRRIIRTAEADAGVDADGPQNSDPSATDAE